MRSGNLYLMLVLVCALVACGCSRYGSGGLRNPTDDPVKFEQKSS